MAAGSLFLGSLCMSIYGPAFERMFLSRCICAIISDSANLDPIYSCICAIISDSANLDPIYKCVRNSHL